LPPKSGPNAKGQAGDGPGLESVELPLPLETEHRNAMELEKVRMEFELTLLKYLHQENERQRQHEEVMEQLQQQQQQQQALPHQVAEWALGCGCTGLAMHLVCWSQVWLRGGEHHVAASTHWCLDRFAGWPETTAPVISFPAMLDSSL
jgi:hypothetical protein